MVTLLYTVLCVLACMTWGLECPSAAVWFIKLDEPLVQGNLRTTGVAESEPVPTRIAVYLPGLLQICVAACVVSKWCVLQAGELPKLLIMIICSVDATWLVC
jgi:positive regulator of sigma E activity